MTSGKFSFISRAEVSISSKSCWRKADDHSESVVINDLKSCAKVQRGLHRRISVYCSVSNMPSIRPERFASALHHYYIMTNTLLRAPSHVNGEGGGGLKYMLPPPTCFMHSMLQFSMDLKVSDERISESAWHIKIAAGNCNCIVSFLTLVLGRMQAIFLFCFGTLRSSVALLLSFYSNAMLMTFLRLAGLYIFCTPLMTEFSWGITPRILEEKIWYKYELFQVWGHLK